MTTHLGRRHSPDLVVIGSHENIGKTSTHLTKNPLVKVLGLGGGCSSLKSSIDQTIDTFDLVLLGENGNIVLEGVRHPLALYADVRDTLVVVPVLFLWQGLIQTVIKVFVVGEDDVASNIVELE